MAAPWRAASFTGGCGFAGTVDTDEEDDTGLALERLDGDRSGCGHGIFDEVTEDGADAPEGLIAFAPAAPEPVENGLDGPGPKVGGVENLLDLIGGFGVELRLYQKGRLLGGQRGSRGSWRGHS